jgi:hypothetical protein
MAGPSPRRKLISAGLMSLAAALVWATVIVYPLVQSWPYTVGRLIFATFATAWAAWFWTSWWRSPPA